MFYTHGYPGSWSAFPKLQIYHSKGAATRQAKKLEGARVTTVTLETP